jgi:hypothetical protein
MAKVEARGKEASMTGKHLQKKDSAWAKRPALTPADATAPATQAIQVEPALDSVATRPAEVQDQRDITAWDEEVFRSITSAVLTPEQRQRLAAVRLTYPRQRLAMAVHWHPEFLPLELCMERFRSTFPNLQESLVLPTQHNQILTLDGYAGVEVDCYSSGFNRKVQLLLHFRADKVARANALKSMLDHTFKYRSSQFFEFMDSILDPRWERRMQEAIAQTGADEKVVGFVRTHAHKLRRLVKEHESTTPPEMIKNKVLSDYFQALKEKFPGWLVNRSLVLLKVIKDIAKREFSLQYFYRASEIIEETRYLGGGIVIPHPEQFWPILMADYDVDGYEVWNPASREYTEFLIKVVNRENRSLRPGRRKVLIFMGDDTHMSEKAKPPPHQNPDKANREVGVQPAWEEMSIRKSLMLTGVSLAGVIEAYKARLG